MSIKSMEYYLQPNDWLVISVGILLLISFGVYIYYVMQDSEDTPVSKEELTFVALSSLVGAIGTGVLVFILMNIRINAKYPPVDGVDMGDAPF